LNETELGMSEIRKYNNIQNVYDVSKSSQTVDLIYNTEPETTNKEKTK